MISEAIKELNISICECSATPEEKEIMIYDLAVLVRLLMKRDANE